MQSFFPRLNNVLTQPDLREFSSADPLSGDVETVQMKRRTKVPTGPNIVVEDSHRLDVVLVTRPKKRKFKGIANKDPTLLSTGTIVNLSSDDSMDTVIVEPHRRGTRARTAVSEEPVVIEETPRRATRARPADSKEPVVIEETYRRAMRRRPAVPEPMMSEEIPCRATRSIPVPEPDHEWVEEHNVMRGMLFLCRISSHGKSPSCRGSKCKGLIRDSGLKRQDVGVVGICWLADNKFSDKGIPYVYWFCPNNQCCKKSCLSSSITGTLPQIPSKFPVARGTNLSEEEVLFLQERGVDIGSIAFPLPNEEVSVGDIILDLNAYPEQINAQRPDVRLTRRNTIPRRRRSDIPKDAWSRIRSARTEAMVCRSIRKIETGNATGLRLMVNNVSRGTSSTHCVQICVFPACSCKDFMHRESMVKYYFPCKHMYWCFAKICNRDIDNDQSINQPILTLNEVHELVRSASID